MNQEEKSWERKISYMKVMIGSTSSVKLKVSSIFKVPQKLGESRMDAYRPKMVSIGPLHRGTNKELLYMEEIKWHCVRSLLLRTQDPAAELRKCSDAIYDADEMIRAAYTDEIMMNRSDLAQIMLLDGCFLLELLISNHKESDMERPSGELGPGDRVGKMDLVLSDLKLIENQIPIFIVFILYHRLCKSDYEKADYYVKADDDEKAKYDRAEYEKARKVVNSLVLSLFGCSPDSREIDSPKCAHFVDLIHWFMTREDQDASHHKKNNDVSITVESGDPTPKLNHCAWRLQAVGVKIKASYGEKGTMSLRLEDNDVIILGCDKSFNKRTAVLKIQPLDLTEETEVLWRNFIAWENNRSAHEKCIASTETRTSRKFSHYALLFKDLICCEHDVSLLKEQQVLIDQNKSNEDLVTFFTEIAKEVQVDSEFSQLIYDLNAHSYAGQYWWKIFWHYCQSILTRSRHASKKMYLDLKRDYIGTVWQTVGVIAAIVLLGLTIAQTVFGALSL